MPLCGRCGTDNPAEARFCFACGTALSAARAPARDLRKTVTIVFSDLAGSTRLGERLDSESLRQVMSRYFETMATILEHHGGTVEKFIGDAVMAVFGIPVVREDDAVRAVRATAEMRDALEDLNARLEARYGVRLRVRTGVNTGEVVAGDAALGQRFATGDAVNVAARLEQAAGADEILISEATHRLVRDAVRVEPVEPLELKGKSQRVPAFRLEEVVADAPGVARRLDSPIVGREREMGRLRAALERASNDRACQLVTVLGPAGVGKSRLAHELRTGVAGRASVLLGRCLPYGEGITFWPVAEVVRRAAGITAGDAPDEARAKVAALVPAGDDASTIVDRVAGVMGLAETSASPEETSWALRKLIEAVAAERPLVLVFDDVHWAEDTFVDLLRHLAERGDGLPVLLLVLARPDVLETHAWLGDGTVGQALTLDALSDEETGLLIDNLLEHAPAAEELRERVTAAGGGNPLFVEELLRMLIDEGALARDGGRWKPGRDLATVRVPPTIQALLAARLDRLTPPERTAIERAAVIGRVFWPGALRALAPEDDPAAVDELVAALAGKELVQRRGPRLGGEDGLCFSHILIRDVAYEGMLKADRATLHERFADWLEAQAGERATEYEEILGYHLERSHRYRMELAPLDARAARTGERAAERLGRGGGRALARGDMPAAVNLLERALALVADEGAQRADLSLKLGIALTEVGELDRADSLLADRLDFERRDRRFLSFRDGRGKQRRFDLDDAGERVTIGRREENDVSLAWDVEVSRFHAALERAGEGWTLVDEGMSRNGSFVNGTKVRSRQVLRDGDVVRLGDTVILYRAPALAAPGLESAPAGSGVTAMAPIPVGAEGLSETERRILAALSSQVESSGGAAAAGPRIADELAMTPDDVEETLARLVRRFHTDHLPEDQRHGRLVERASRSGLFQRPG